MPRTGRSVPRHDEGRTMSSWFMPETVPAAAIRLFCFSYAGGGASTFRSWPRDDSLGVVPVQLPGRENRMAEAPLLSMDEIVEQTAQAMLPYVDAPYALFGHSLGARVGFEVARFMRRRGHALPVHLFVSGSRAPEIPEPQPLHDLDEDEFFTALARYGGTSRIFLENREVRKLFLPMLRADFTVDETYRYWEEAALPLPGTAFFGSADREADASEVQGWEKQTCRKFNCCEIPGDHFFVTRASGLVVARIRAELSL